MSYSIRKSTDREDDDTLIYHHESRLSRNSTGAKEEFVVPREGEELEPATKKGGRELMIVFTLMVFIGLVRSRN